jgi:hypothetical protein
VGPGKLRLQQHPPHQQQRQQQQQQQPQQQKKTQNRQQPQQVPRERIATYEVTEDGKSFVEIVKRLKRDVPEAGNVDIVSVRRNKAGNVEVRARDPGKKLLESINSLSGVQSREKIRYSFLHVKGMDATVTGAEIEAAIVQTLCCANGVVEVTSVRPAYGDSQKATLKLPSELAQQLLRREKVRIGWVMCKVTMRIEQQRCYRCWHIGHVAQKCGGVDRRLLCFNCGEEGHKADGCTSSPKCLNCGELGHRTGRCVTEST